MPHFVAAHRSQTFLEITWINNNNNNNNNNSNNNNNNNNISFISDRGYIENSFYKHFLLKKSFKK